MNTGSTERAALEMLSRALDVPSDARADWVRQNCEGNEALEQRVLALLNAERSNPGALKTGGAGSDATDAPIPERIGAYRIVGTIGQGGMGAVYKAERIAGNFDQTAAIKVIRPGVLSDALIERFQRERQILAALNHPNIARLYDGGEMDDGSPFMIMEYVDGLPVLTWAEQNSASYETRLDLFAKLCGAVQFAHQNLIIHRDITPSNVLVSRGGDLKLIDFGISRPPERVSAPSAGTSGSAKSRSLSYTPGYAAPERLNGAFATTLSDIFSLGKLLDDLIKPGERNRELSAIIACACAADPSDRYASVDALEDDIQSLRAQRSVSAYRGGAVYRLGKFLGRHKISTAAVAAVFIGLSGALAATAIQFNRAETSLALANARFAQARALTRTIVFDIYDKADKVSGTLEVREALAGVVREYITGLQLDTAAPADVLLEVGIITSRLADLYGGIGIANLGKNELSRELFLDAQKTLDEVLTRDPADSVAILELIMVERMLCMQDVFQTRDLTSARAHNKRGFELVEQGLALNDENAPRILRHFWSLRTDLLQILENENNNEEALEKVVEWRTEITPELATRMDGSEEMGAYLAMQHATTLIGLDRGAEAIEPLNYTIAYRSKELEKKPDSYYQLTQLMVAHGEHASASRLAGDLEAAARHADKAVELSREIMATNPDDAGGPEGVSVMLQKRATAQSALGNASEARSALDESQSLMGGLVKQFPGDVFYEANLLHIAAQAVEVDTADGASAWSCGLIRQVRSSFDVDARLADPAFVPDRKGLEPYLKASCPA